MKLIISIDGRIGSGKSTIINKLREELKKIYGVDVPHYSCGQYYRTHLQDKIPNDRVDDAMIEFMVSVYENNDIAIIDGRSVSFAIKTANVLKSDKPFISVLLDVDKDVQLTRLLERAQSGHPEPIKYAMERDARDESRCFSRYKKNIFDKKYYDLYLNTSTLRPDQAVKQLLMDIIQPGKIRKKTLLFAEETETPLGRKLLERHDINTIYLRFTEHLNFNEQYMLDTYNQNIFTVFTSRQIEDEIMRFHSWASEIGMFPDYFYNGSEFLQEKANRFAGQLGLSALSEEQSLHTRDKVEMKKRLQSVGIRVNEFQPVDSMNDIIHFVGVYGYPIIFKRRKGQSCIDTYKISSQNDIDNLPIQDPRPGKFMVEKFNPEREWIIDGLIQDGIVAKTFVTYVPTAPLTAMTDRKLRGHIACPETPTVFKFDPTTYIQQVVSTINLNNGYIHLECFLEQDGTPTVGEFGWRPSGHRIIDNHSMVTGVDIYDKLVDVATGKKVEFPKTAKQPYVGSVFLPKKDGEITDMMSKDQILSQDGVIAAELFPKIGEKHQLQRKSSETFGYAFIEGESIESVERNMQLVFNAFFDKMKTK